MKNKQEKLSLHGLWLSVSSSSSPPSRPSFNSIRELDSVVASGLAAATGSLLWPPPPQPLGLIDSWDPLLRNEIIEGEKWILKCTSPITSLIHFYHSVLFNDLLNNLPPWHTSAHFPGASKVLPKGFKCRLARTVDVSILATGMLGRNEDTHPRAAESGGLGNAREEF